MINDENKFNYQRLQNIEEFFRSQIFEKDIDLSKVVIVACQHLLEPQKIMFQKIMGLGILPENMFILGKAYSTNDDILNECKNLGIFTLQPKYNPNVSFDDQHKENCNNIWELSREKRALAEKIIILDDGGILLSVAVNDTDTSLYVGIEQTSSGFRKLESQKISFPIFNVARSPIKLELETPFIIDVGFPRILESINYFKIDNPRFLVIGLGPIGLELEKRIRENNFFVTSYDKIHGEQNIDKIILDNTIDVIIGATGSQVISHDEIAFLNSQLNKKAIFVSMSSSDREFEIWKLRDLFSLKKTIHDDIHFENITILNGGFPITFKGNCFEVTPAKIEKTIGLLFSGVCLGILDNDLEKGIIHIPESITKLLES